MRSKRSRLLLPLLLATVASGAYAADPAPKPGATPPTAAPLPTAAPPAPTAPPVATSAPAPERRPVPTGKTVDPAAIEALDKMGAYLRSLGSFAIEADMTTDDVLASGQKVKYSGLAQLK